MNLSVLRWILPVCLAATSEASATVFPEPALAKATIKLATLVPDGSVWDKAFRKMGSEWKQETDGRVQLRIYPGGAAGDEPDIIRKMRIGQLHGASLTVSGLATIDDAFRIFEIPLYFASHEEANYVLEKLTPIFAKRLEEKGFVLLHWGHVGWIHLFSTKPVRQPDDLRALKQFVWGGDADAGHWWKANGFQPVPLSVTDIPMGIETGLIQAFPAPPLSALGYQWFRSAPYMMELGAAPFVGATLLTKKAWSKISPEDQALLLAVGQRTEAALSTDVPEHERQAIAEMEKRGLKVIAQDDEAAWQELAERFAKQIGPAEIPAEIFGPVEKHRREFRQANSIEDRPGGSP